MILDEKKDQLMSYWRTNFNFSDEELNAFSDVKREFFVVDKYVDNAYEDNPLPLLRGKTISQPTTVMLMTSALEIEKGEKVYEVGTGSGYQTALLSKLVGDSGEVTSTEVIPELVSFSKSNLKKSGITNVEVFEMDGSKGIFKDVPFDKIIITAACRDFPQELLDNLKVGGLIVAPVGNEKEQTMVLGKKLKDGRLELEFLGSFLFSPLYGSYGFEV